nr:hypothetical protein [Tanacetum cinerariifolium]
PLLCLAAMAGIQRTPPSNLPRPAGAPGKCCAHGDLRGGGGRADHRRPDDEPSGHAPGADPDAPADPFAGGAAGVA